MEKNQKAQNQGICIWRLLGSKKLETNVLKLQFVLCWLLRSKKGHNEISPKQKNKSSPKGKNSG